MTLRMDQNARDIRASVCRVKESITNTRPPVCTPTCLASLCPPMLPILYLHIDPLPPHPSSTSTCILYLHSHPLPPHPFSTSIPILYLHSHLALSLQTNRNRITSPINATASGSPFWIGSISLSYLQSTLLSWKLSYVSLYVSLM